MVSALYTTHLGGGGGSFISVVSALYTTHLGGRKLYICGLCLIYNTPRGGKGALYLWSLPYIQHT